MITIPTEQATAAVEVVSLDDRRRIKSLEAQVADLQAKLAAAHLRVQPALEIARGTCSHLGPVRVAQHGTKVTCAGCGAAVDPVDVLRRIARQEVNFCYELNALRDERERLAKDVDRLKAARARLVRQTARDRDMPPAGVAALCRDRKVTALGMRRIGGSWFVEATSADGGRARGDGQLEDAIVAVFDGLKPAVPEELGG